VRLLVVEDTPKMSALLQRAFREDGYAVDIQASGNGAVWMASECDFDAVILDVGLPDIDGFDVCRQLRQRARWMPILMLTAREAVPDRVHGLDAGADDYVTKPFDIEELRARVRALVRRTLGERPAVLTVGDLVLDPAAHTVRRVGTPISLAAKEFAVLEYFMRHPGQVISRARFLEHVWDFAGAGDSNIVDVYVRILRDKVDRPFGTQSIQTVRGVGYRLASLWVSRCGSGLPVLRQRVLP
jgi:two-component system OmpR family response regulator